MLLPDSDMAPSIMAALVSLLVTTTTIILVSLPGVFATPVPTAYSQPLSQAYDRPPVTGYFPEPEPCHGNCSWIHDPNIVYADGTYWRLSTSGNIAIASAPSLSGPWDYRGALLHNGTKIFLREDQDIWAPSVSKRGNLYYCHYSVSYIYSQHSEIGVATSMSLEPGTWEDHGAIGLPQNERYNLIDPYVFQDNPEGPIYFTFGSYWSGIQQIEFNKPEHLIGWVGQTDDIINIISNTTSNFAVVEGANMHKSGRFYYVFFSVGQCCRTPPDLAPPGDEYHIAVCRSSAPTGPFVDKDGNDCLMDSGGTTILASHGDVYAPGGQGVMVHPDSGRTIIYYHYVKPSLGYMAHHFFFGYNYLDFEDGWPVVVEA